MEGDGKICRNTFFNTNFNPLPPCGGRPACDFSVRDTCLISIHSLRVEGDCDNLGYNMGVLISIHSLRVEGDCQLDISDIVRIVHFNPLPPCGGRPSIYLMHGTPRHISIHSLRVEGDPTESEPFTIFSDFNPLPPCGGRLWKKRWDIVFTVISIHSLRVEGDVCIFTTTR